MQSRGYFTPPEPYFWRWQDAGQVVGWTDNRTIAFRDEIVQILERLVPEGLPPLGSLLLLLAACRANWLALPARRGMLAGILRQDRPAMPPADLALLTEVCDRLDALHASTPEPVRASMALRAELCEAVFCTQRQRLDALDSTQMILGLQVGLTPESLDPVPTQHPDAILRRDLQVLKRGLERCETSRLPLRAKTGISQQLRRAPIEIPQPLSARALITQLKDNPELGALARLARRLLSVVQWPRPLDSLIDMPLGGVSDIANRGPLDRLLLSELAYDDLTLAARVANGEALYLRREVPPSAPPRQRIVLMDVGIRTWGLPRVFVSAVGLALAAGSDPQMALRAFRSNGTDIEAVDFASQAGLAEHLAALDFRAHPGAAFEKWEQACVSGADTVLVTVEDVLDDPDFVRALERLKMDEWYIITVNREGRFRQYRRTRSGGKLLREAEFSLDDVLERQPNATPLVGANDGGPLPAFVLQDPSPLLFSRPVNARRAWHARYQGVFSLTNDDRLLRWTHPGRGAQELAAGLPNGSLHACQTEPPAIQAVVGRLSRNGLTCLTIFPDSNLVSRATLQLDADNPREVFFHAGFVFVRFDKQVAVCDPGTGAQLASAQAVGIQSCGRFIRMLASDQKLLRPRSYWCTVAFDGHQVRFERLEFKNVATESIIGIFETVEASAPAAITREGGIVFGDGSRKAINRSSTSPIGLIALSRDNHRAVIRDINAGPQRDWLVYLLNGRTEPIQGTDFSTQLEPRLREYARPAAVRSKFSAVAVDSQRRLSLLSRRGAQLPLEMQKDQYFMAKQGTTGGQLKHEVFRTVEAWRNTPNAGLSVATWPNGDRLFLDSRGLLHCQAADRRVPEFSIVLAEGETAGWCSDGTRWGSAYFCGDHAIAPARKAYNDVIVPFIEGLR